MSALKGTTKAMHTTVGFGLAALGSWAVASCSILPED
jgi:hypothetical protein